jgi:hypothetical protein
VQSYLVTALKMFKPEPIVSEVNQFVLASFENRLRLRSFVGITHAVPRLSPAIPEPYIPFFVTEYDTSFRPFSFVINGAQ